MIDKRYTHDEDIETVINMTNKNGRNVEDRMKKSIQNMNQKRQKRKKRIKNIIKYSSIIIIAIIGIVFALTSPLFNIKEIKVENNNILSTEKIVSVSGLKLDDNIFRFLKSDIEKYIKEEPYIEDVKISRELPDTVKIDVKEKQRDFYIKFLNGYAYINNQGYILEIADKTINIPVIQGLETPEEEIAPGKRLNNNDLKKLENVIQIMTVAKENEIDSKITGIDISNKNDYILYLEEEKKSAHIGNTNNLTTKILYIKEIMEKYEAGKEGTIFVNGDFTNKFKAYFREKV